MSDDDDVNGDDLARGIDRRSEAPATSPGDAEDALPSPDDSGETEAAGDVSSPAAPPAGPGERDGAAGGPGEPAASATDAGDPMGGAPAGADDPADLVPAEPPAADQGGFDGAGHASAELTAIIEALIFASPDPITFKALLKLLDGEPREDVEASLEALRQAYEDGGGLHLVEVAGGYQITTRPELHEWVRRLFHERKTTKLSVQALETLAVIAYKQPITAPEIADIRAVNTSGVLATLLERHLIRIAGRKQVVGRPFLYATTREFLIRFGLRDLGDLPKIEDMADVLGFEPPEGLLEPQSTGLLPLEGEAIGFGGAAVSPADDEQGDGRPDRGSDA